MKYLQLVRYKNLLLLIVMFLVFKFGFLDLQHIPLALSNAQYSLLVLSILFITAAGYVINDIMDQETDAINKPNRVIIEKSITENLGYTIYVVLNCIGVGLGFWVSNLIDKGGLSTLFIFSAAALYFYATSLKQMPVVGNLTVAFLASLSLLMVGIFNLYPILNESNFSSIQVIFGIIFDYSIVMFWVHFCREICKDIEDLEGDKAQGMRTLPLVFGVKRTVVLLIVLLTVLFGLILKYIYSNLIAFELYGAALYVLIFIEGPLLLSGIHLMKAKSKDEFKSISTLLKWLLFFGILSIWIITLNIKYNNGN